jgi:hypothetical protein
LPQELKEDPSLTAQFAALSGIEMQLDAEVQSVVQ